MTFSGRVLALFITTGCVGRPVVDITDQALPPPPCGAWQPACVFDPGDLTPVDPVRFQPAQACERTWRCDLEGSAVCEEGHVIEVPSDRLLSGQDYDCAEVAVDLAAGVTLTLESPSFRGAVLRVDGERGASVLLREPLGAALSLQLEGRAWVEVEGANLEGLRVDGRRSDSDGELVSISRSQLLAPAFRTSPRASLRFDRSTIREGVIDAWSVVSEATDWRASTMIAEALLMTRGSLRFSEAALGDVSLIDTVLEDTTVHRCGSLSGLGAVFVEGSTVTRCSQGAELVGGLVDGAQVAGPLTARGTRFQRAEFGFFGELDLDEVSVENAALCDVEALRAEESVFSCVSCEPQIPHVELVATTARAPGCPVLEE